MIYKTVNNGIDEEYEETVILDEDEESTVFMEEVQEKAGYTGFLPGRRSVLRKKHSAWGGKKRV